MDRGELISAIETARQRAWETGADTRPIECLQYGVIHGGRRAGSPPVEAAGREEADWLSEERSSQRILEGLLQRVDGIAATAQKEMEGMVDSGQWEKGYLVGKTCAMRDVKDFILQCPKH